MVEVGLLAAWALISMFFIAPILVVIPLSFSSTEYFVFPPREFSVALYRQYFASYSWMRATVISFEVAAATAAVSTCVGTLAALGLARLTGPRRALVNSFVIAPMVVPHIVLAIGLYRLLASWHLIGTLTGLICAHTMLT